MKRRYAEIAGWGMYVPSREVPNDTFVTMGLDTSDEWIASRTGIERRRFVGPDEATSDMAVKAARQAMAVSGLNAGDVDMVIVATTTPDHVMPATASIVQDKLGMLGAGAMDLNAACAGFTYALSTAAALVESGRAKNILVIGADELSIYLDFRDRSTCVLFGDGAGAVVLRHAKEPGIMGSTQGSDGSGAGLLTIPGGGSRIRTNGKAANSHNGAGNGSGNGSGNGHQRHRHDGNYLKMNGPQIFRWATQIMPRAAEEVMAASGLKPEHISLFIPHQANNRIMEATAKRLGLPPEKVFSNVRSYGNTSAASIPIALCEALQQDRIHVGDYIVLSSFGAGLTWSALALRWSVPIPKDVRPWQPIARQVQSRMAAVRSVLRRGDRAVRTQIDKTRGKID
ncbi:MAG TPA: beta-ketoacyl-ACP synthase III [Dehalococcoidia bacterium]|nr:beta-ketoacyl-ACP synthase III [Dehalococcoidia bacterium]